MSKNNLIRRALRAVNDEVWIASLKKYRTRMGWCAGRKYQSFHDRAKREYTGGNDASVEIIEAAMHYQREGWATFNSHQISLLMRDIHNRIESNTEGGWNSEGQYIRGDIWRDFPQIEKAFERGIGAFVELVFNSHFKIFYGKMYQSLGLSKKRSGSQLWHADGGPGTCMNLMLCVSEVNRRNGAMELLSWEDSLIIFKRERKWHRNFSGQLPGGQSLSKIEYRAERAKWIGQEILSDLKINVHQPEGNEGMVLAFNNNLIHKGGGAQKVEKRVVSIFHLYPSCAPVAYDIYRSNGIAKNAPFPPHPDF